jgi:hypothetical protein
MSLVVVFSVVGGVTAPVAPSPVQDAEAQTAGDTLKDAGCASIGVVALLLSECTVEYGELDTEGLTAEGSQLSIYSTASVMESERRQEVEESTAHSNQTLGIMQAEAKYEIIRQLNQGATQAEAQRAAISKINEQAASQQKSLIVSENRQANQVKDMVSEANQTTGLEFSNISLISAAEAFAEATPQYSNGVEFKSVNLTLYDATEVEAVMVVGNSPNYTQTSYGLSESEADSLFENRTVKQIPDYDDVTSLSIKNPLENEKAEALNYSEFRDAHNRTEQNRQTAISNAEVMTSDIYQKYSPGDISVSDVKSPAEVVRTSSSDLDSTGSYSYALLSAAEMGYSTEAGSSFVIDYNATDAPARELSGGMFADPSAFNNSTVVSGQTYNTSELNGSVYFVNQKSGAAEQVNLDGEFTVTEIVDVTTGESVNETTFTKHTFATTNTDDINSQTDSIIDTRNTVDSTKTGGAGSLFDGRVIGNDILVLGGIVLAITYLARREQ